MFEEKHASQYFFLEMLGKSIYGEIFKAYQHNQPDRIMAIKRIRPEFNTKGLLHHLFRNIDNLQKLDIEGIIKPDLYFVEGDFIYLVQDYFDGINLQLWKNEKGGIELDEFFTISFRLSQILNNFHESGIFHGGVKPANILINPQTLDIVLIDPVRVIDVNEISHYIFNEYFRINTLPYISPEQTGRIRQNVDYETDMYSLGIVFYELLIGMPPFVSTDPLKIIYLHLTEIPEPIHNKRDGAPEVIGNIIAKLLAKEPERRYQTGVGLLHDLEKCWKDYRKEKNSRIFALGLRDFSNRITLPSIMVGRETEKECLLTEHAISCKGEFRAVIISGLPGIGKTRLIQELERPIIANRGYFTYGKFDQYQKNVPYSTLIQAFGNLVRILLTEDEKRVELRRDQITKALGNNGRLITDLVPELNLIIGEQPEVTPLPPTEARNRFNDVVEHFIASLAGPEHPLTLFIDDLQWCDSATIDVLENLFLNSKEHPYLFLLGAYRNNEVYQGHPLRNHIERLHKMERPFIEIQIDELKPDHTTEMVANILNASTDRIRDLSGIVNMTSEGNPLYVNETLSWFYENNLIFPDRAGVWQWDTEKIKKSPIPKSIEQMFMSKILRIPGDSLRLLQIAACLGVKFRINDLIMVSGIDEADIYKELAPAFSHRILIRKKDSLSFFHDRVQEAAYSTLNEKSRQIIHGLIAEAYIEAIPEGSALETLDNLFDIIAHLNKGEIADGDNKNLLRDAKLYHSAGKKAYSSLALEAANLYFRKSAGFLDEAIWDSDYKFVYSLYKYLAMSELVMGNQDRVRILLDTLLENSRTDLDRAECLVDQAANLSSLGEFQRAIDLSIQGLAYLGKSFPENNEDVLIRIDKLGRTIKEKNVSTDEIPNREILTNRRDLAEIAFYNHLIPNYYLLGRPSSFFLAGLEAAYLCLFIGIHEQSIYPFAIYMAFLLEQGDYEKAFIYEDLVIKLCRKFPNTFGAIRGMDSVSWLTFHWRNHPSFILKFSLESIDVGNASCDTFHAGLAYCAAFWIAIFQGNDLNIVENLVSECKKYSNKYNLPFFSEGMARGMSAAWIEPMKTAVVSIDITKDIDKWKKSNDFALLGNYYIHSGVAKYYLGNYKAADEHLKNGKGCLIGHTNNIPNRQWHIFYVLNSLRLLVESPSKEELNVVLSNIQPIIEKLEFWAAFGPALKPYLAFIKAEIQSVKGDFSEMRRLYLDAIDIANKEEYTLLEGFIHESLGDLLLKRGVRQAYFHINEAANLYEKCHGCAKLNQIREKYPEYITCQDDKKLEKIDTSQRFDTLYMMKAAQVIYQELDIDELVQVIMRLLMEVTGSPDGYLLTGKGDDLVIRVKGEKENTISVSLAEEGERLSETTGISQAMVRYVYRTREPLILDDAANEGGFSNDRETLELGLRSVFIHPIIRQSKLVAIVCLQNNLMKSVFSAKEIEVVRQLSMHAAVAMENAALVEYMKDAEKALRESEALLRQSQELSRMVAWDWNSAENSVKWYGDMISLFGKPADKIITIGDFIDSVHPEDVENLEQEIQKTIDATNDYSYRAEYRVIHPNGKVLWLRGQGGVTHNDDGQVTNFAGIVMNITDRKQAEIALRESEQRYQKIIAATQDGVVIIDNNGIILDANPAYCKMLGYSYDEIIGMNIENLVHPDHRHHVQDEFAAQILEMGKVRLDAVNIHKDGSLVLVEIHGVIFNHAGQGASLAIVRDITERKNAEIELEKYRDHLEDMVKERTAQIEDANRDLEAFSYSVSHDLRAPLRAINGFSQIIIRRYKNMLNNEACHYFENIIEAGGYMENLIDDILKYSRLGRTAVKKIDIHLGKLFEKILKLLDEKIKKNNGRVTIPDDLPVLVADETLLMQIFVNLINNSLTYHQKNIPPEVEISWRDDAGKIILNISENGIGIAPKFHEKVFDMFQRLHSQDEYPGTGIGLTLTKKAVEMHGAIIKLDSEVGRGATFSITLDHAG